MHLPVLASCALLAPLAAQSGGPAELTLVEATHGHDQLLPHRIEELDANGVPNGAILDVRQLADLRDNLSPTNGVLPAEGFPPTAVLPGGQPGNHFLALRFSRPLDVDSVLDPTDAGKANSGLTGAISVVAVDPLSGATVPVKGRALVGGKTYAGPSTGGVMELQSWVVIQGGALAPTGVDNDSDGVPDGLGFPGTVTGTSFPGDLQLVGRETFVFVADTDGDLETYETFPSGLVLAVRANEAVRDRSGRPLPHPVFASTQVGMDLLTPEISVAPPPSNAPYFVPGNGDVDVDPYAEVAVRFTESVQPLSIGAFDGGPPKVSATVQLEFGAPGYPNPMAFTVRPEHVFDLGTWILTPAFPFPGMGDGPQGPVGNQVDERLYAGQLADLSGNVNLLPAASFFRTGPGAGLANAPVTPDAIYVGLGGPHGGISVLDLNGFGASTGDPRYGDIFSGTSRHTDTNYPDNPNLKFHNLGLKPGTTTIDGGSAGVFTLTLDSNLEPNLLRGQGVVEVRDMALGRSLDVVFNNAPPPFGCQSGGGNLCALHALQTFSASLAGPSTLGPDSFPNALHTVQHAPNPISWAPHPNPPPIVTPPLCLAPFIPSQEPISVEVQKTNLLAPGDPFGNPVGNPPWPPSGLLSKEQNSWFVGPSPPKSSIDQCFPFMIRQQVGQFLYALDPVREEILVVNSNRMVVIDRIAVPNPTRMAMGTNLDLLAVTQARLDQVSFIDVDPTSATFHQVVKETAVGDRPLGVAWDPANEDVLVCNQGDGSLSVLSVFSLEVRKVVTNLLTQPIDVAITPRQTSFGFERNVYFAYIIQRDGTVAVFESGPDGLGGWGYDDVIGLAPFEFKNPKVIQPVPSDLRSAVAIAHEGSIDLDTGQAGPYGEGAVSILAIDSALFGQQNLTPDNVDDPQFRDLMLAVVESVGEEELSGIPTDLAMDNLRNLGALANEHNVFSAGAPIVMNGRGLVRDAGGAGILAVSAPDFLFAVVPEPKAGGGVGGGGRVDALRLDVGGLPRQDTNPYRAGVQSVRAPRARVLMDAFRQ